MTDNNHQVETTKITDLTPDPQNANAGTERSIEYLPLAELITRLHPENAKEHNVGQIIESYKTHDYVASGVIDNRTGLFLAGHGRIIALNMMKKQGMQPPGGIQNGGDDWLVPVQTGYASKNDMQAKAYLVADNNLTIAGGWNEPALAELLQELANSDEIDIEASGYDSEDLDQLLQDLGMQEEPTEDPGAQVDQAAELNKKWQVQRGDVWEIPSASGENCHRIMCGDSTCAEDVGLLMGGVKAEILFTSPPYSDQREYSGNDLSIDTLTKFIPTWKQWCEFQCVNLGIKIRDFEIVEYWDDYIKTARECGLKLLAWNVWDKKESGSIGMQSAMFATQHEWIFVFGEKTKKMNRTVSKSDNSIKRYKNYAVDEQGRKINRRRQSDGSIKTSTVGEFYDKKQLPSVLSVHSEKGTLRQLHPAIMGIGAAIDYVEAMTDSEDIVCDPFLGSGTTMVAAEQLGRVGYGMEIAEAYVGVCLERLSGMGLTPERTTK